MPAARSAPTPAPRSAAWRAAGVALLMSASIVGAGCAQNFFSEFANKSSDEALLFEAKSEMDLRKWTSAISIFQRMSATALAKRAVKFQYASAYAGRCGLDLIALANSLSSSSTNLFATLMTAFQGATTSQPADCAQALTILSSISQYASGRTVDENTLVAFVALADIGVRLAAYADASPANGVVDAGWDSCTSSPMGPPQAAPGTAADASARQIGADFNYMVDSLSASGMPTIIGAVQSQLTTICSAMYSLYPTYAICGGAGAINLDPTAFTQLQVSAIEGLIRTNSQPGLSIVNKALAPSGSGGAFCL